jgi:hypothetical protein
LFGPLTLAETDPRAAAVLIDELDAGGFERASNDLKCGAAWLTSCRLKLMHGHDAHARPLRKLLLAPCKKATGCPALSWGDHEVLVPKLSDSHNSIENLLTDAKA